MIEQLQMLSHLASFSSADQANEAPSNHGLLLAPKSTPREQLQ